MASFNQVLLMGNLTRDPVLKYLPSQMQVVEFGIACSRKFKTAAGEDREETAFVECSAFARTAEVINQYFTKGKPIFIQGRLKYDSWEDKNGGGKRSKLSVVVDTFQFIGGKDGGGQGGGGGNMGSGAYDEGEAPQQRSVPPQRGPAPQRSAAPQRSPAPQQPFGEEEQFKDDDIPF